ncbi:type IX secretion system ring subunit PorN/GldN [Psychroflexus aestuariivivens]|uniref:type IX secretion system ring protein PorN/GldN n=1 Tax=Psychroflexus aestuariivivens TaxID=1795040 RepID=UPI000FDBCF7A|nr:gliding motility protein GldN [Psychroflexus aestuariivivens]
MKRFNLNFLASLFFLAAAFSASAQSNILNAEKPEDVGVLTEDQEKYDDDEPLEYGYVGDRDVLWSKVVWEKIDLNQKVNFPLLYPTNDNSVSKDRRSLFQVLLDAIEAGATGDTTSQAPVTEVYATSYFNKKRSFEDVQDALKAIFLPDVALDILGQYGVTGTEAVQQFITRSISGNLENYPELYPSALIDQMEPYIIPTEITGNNILEYHIKGMWYFDKVQGEMRYRLLGIAPAGYDIQTQNPSFTGEPQVIPYFWVWFPDARQALHEAKVLNKDNSSMPFSFDHLLNSRRFDAVIYKTENVYEDREVDEYIQDNALMQLLESDRIKEEIRNFELDMWNY